VQNLFSYKGLILGFLSPPRFGALMAVPVAVSQNSTRDLGSGLSERGENYDLRLALKPAHILAEGVCGR
jgi:hypothetical protein